MLIARIGLGLMVATTAVLLSACGTSAEEEAEARQAACQESVGGFLEALQDLDGRLDVGVVYNDYSTKVGDIAGELAQIDKSAIEDPDCESALGSGEVALISYRRAGEIWSRCIQVRLAPGCRTSEARSARLQPHWAIASTNVERMSSKVRDLGEPD